MNLEDIPEEELDRVIQTLMPLTVRTPLDYVPHAKQLSFHQSTAKIRLLSGGNQSGKTLGGVCEVLFHATGLYPEWYPQDQRINRPNRGRIIGEDYGKWDGEVLEPKLMEWLPRELIVSIRKTMKGYIEKVYIKHVSGGVSSFDIMTHEQDDGVFEGWTGDWVWFDEPPPYEKWVACKRGLIYNNGRAWFTMTPIKEPWVYNDFILNKNPDVFSINVDIRDNPYLTEESIKFFERDLPDDVKEARLHGKFKHLSGRVYKEFDENIHVISNSTIKINSNWPSYFVLDPHDRKPHFCIWARVSPMGTLYITDELQFKGTLKELATKVFLHERMNGVKTSEVIRIADPNKIETPSAINGLTFRQELASHGMFFISNVNDDVTLGHLAVQGKLLWDRTKPISSTNLPKLFFFRENCSECIKYMLMYSWDEYKGSSKDSKGQKETPQDRYKDFPDVVRYLVMAKPGFYDSDEVDPSSREKQESTSFTAYRS